MASRVSVAVALCALTTASIYPLHAGPRKVIINEDGTVSEWVSPGKGGGRDPHKQPGWMKKYNDGTDSGTDGGTGGSDGGTGGTDGSTGGTDGGTDASTGGTDSTTGGTPGETNGDTGGVSDDGTNTGSDLPPLDLSDMKLWNWSASWHASNWDHAFSTIPWRFDHVVQDSTGNTHFLFNESGAPELKAENAHPYSKKARYEVDVTLPELRSGMVVAPLWLWHNDTQDEVDFEFVGSNSLQMTIHTRRTGSHKSQSVKIEGNFSHQRMRLAIETNLDAGEIHMFINGQRVHTFYNNTDAFPLGEMRPVMSMWVGDNVGWAEAWTGPWGGFAEGETLAFTIHGYRYTPM